MNMPLRTPLVTSWPVTEEGRPATLVAALARNAAETGGRAAFRERDRGVWQERNWAETFAEVMALAAALEALGLGPDQALTVIGDNRTRLYSATLAAMALRAFPSPVFPDVPPDELTSYTRHGAPRIAVAEDQEQVDKLLELRERTGRPATILYDDPRGLMAYKSEGLLSLDATIARGRALIEAELRWLPIWSAARAPTTSPCCCIRPERPARPRACRCAIAISQPASTTRSLAATSRNMKIITPICRWPGSAISSSPSAPERCCGSPRTFPSARKRCCATSARSRRPFISPRRARGTIC
jgi:hypothetical protein